MLAGRGFWKDKPSGWDDGIPFCDPNNARVDQKKPSKNKLKMMMKYLVYKFEVMLIL